MNRILLLIAAGCLCCSLCNLAAQTHVHHYQHGATKETIPPPKVFLDKNPRIVWFQLNRLDNARLLLVERKTDDPKYVPVYTAILTRAGMARQDRDEALAGLAAINKSDAASELLSAIDTLEAEDRQDQRTAAQLTAMLLELPMPELAAKKPALEEATKAENKLLRPSGYAGLIVAGETSPAWQSASKSKESTLGLAGGGAIDSRSQATLAFVGSGRQTLGQAATARGANSGD